MEQQTQGTTMKVYELAKELGVDSISLVDKLAGLNIKVKNHMSDLAAADIQAARDNLGKTAKKEEPKKTAPKAATRRKKPEETPAADDFMMTKASKKAPLKASKVEKTAAPEPATPARDAAATGSGSSPIIRRRSTSVDAGEVASQSVVMKRTGATDAEAKPVSTPAAKAAALAHSVGAEPDPVVEPEPIIEEPTAPEEPSPVEAAASETQGTAPEMIQDTPPTPEAPAPMGRIMVGGRAATPIVRKSFLKIVEASPVNKPRIIAQAPVVKPVAPATTGTTTTNAAGRTVIGVKGSTTTADKDGFRIIRMTKENLDQMAEEENAKKKGGPGTPGRGDGVIKPEDVRFADYRKKEVVFMPKRKRTPVGKELKRTQKTTAAAHKRVVEMGDRITVADFAAQMNVKATLVVRKLMTMGVMASMNQSIDFDTAALIGPEFDHEVKNTAFKEHDVLEAAGDDESEKLVSRPPVVTIMGHVDHGKTSLLDAIRSAKVASGEAGGITQHIGAYTVEKNGKLISFIDTPGHEAFTAMRARGANVTDIVILVVAADDGVMPQTREALSHAKAAGVPIIVAMNKMDKPTANPEKIKQQLAELDLLAEDWGGQSQFVPVSAAKKMGLEELLEAVLLNAEVLDLRANPEAPASGTVLEARLEKGRGPVASVLVKRGTLKIGDIVTSGLFTGKVKSLMNDKGATLKSTGPGMPVEILGFEGLPIAGETFNVVENDAAARELLDHRKAILAAERAISQKVSLEDLFAKVQAGATKELNVILKADVSGSVEAIRDSLAKLATDKVKVKVLLASPGGITETDVMLANASKAIILGFNVRPETNARRIAESEQVEIKTYRIIYELIDDVKLAMTGMLDKKKVERFLGRAEVRQIFTVPKLGVVAGCAVIDGKILRTANVRLLRDSRVIFDGMIATLRRFKDDAKEVAEGYECGIGINKFNDIKIGDVIEAYQIDLITPELNT
ncbi:MAG: translation initiation factor IF-2 [Cryobacterium sp.]|nr:translation initiation factor IF-2 [Oligoflexia bacterium]